MVPDGFRRSHLYTRAVCEALGKWSPALQKLFVSYASEPDLPPEASSKGSPRGGLQRGKSSKWERVRARPSSFASP